MTTLFNGLLPLGICINNVKHDFKQRIWFFLFRPVRLSLYSCCCVVKEFNGNIPYLLKCFGFFLSVKIVYEMGFFIFFFKLMGKEEEGEDKMKNRKTV